MKQTRSHSKQQPAPHKQKYPFPLCIIYRSNKKTGIMA